MTWEFTSRSDPVNSTAISRPGTVTLAGARSPAECYHAFYQLDKDNSMGSHIGNFSASTPSGALNVTACAADCDANDTCVSATWVYGSGNDGDCYLFFEGTDIYTWLAVKALPFDTTSQSAVSSSSYVIFKGHSTNNMYGKPVETFGATVGFGEAGTTADDCKTACDNDSSCWGFYHMITNNCFVRTGYAIDGVRSFMNVVGTRVDNTNSATYEPYPPSP